jgi:hypothetical protein
METLYLSSIEGSWERPHLVSLSQWPLRWGPWAGSICLAWELAVNADPQALSLSKECEPGRACQDLPGGGGARGASESTQPAGALMCSHRCSAMALSGGLTWCRDRTLLWLLWTCSASAVCAGLSGSSPALMEEWATEPRHTASCPSQGHFAGGEGGR